MNTDIEWEKWGRLDPYFGVITDPRFRRERVSEADLQFFFETGREHVESVLRIARERFDADFAPRSVLDFGCGVGRLALPFADKAERVVGVDVSASMLAEAARNARERGVGNIEFLHQGDLAGVPPASFDLVHSVMVLQHVEPVRGTAIFGQLVAAVAPRGVGVVHVTYAKAIHTSTLGVPPVPPPPAPAPPSRKALLRSLLRGTPVEPPPTPPAPPPAKTDENADPGMLMNSFPLTPLFFHLQLAQVGTVFSEFTNHGGELGLILYFQKP
jgi:SAM-dependent methyltransferase